MNTLQTFYLSDGKKDSPKSEGKGRNGYFVLDHASLMLCPKDVDGQICHIDICSKRSGVFGPIRLQLTLPALRIMRAMFEAALRDVEKLGDVL